MNSTPLPLVQVSPGELIDKISILEIKARQIDDAAKLANVEKELRLLCEVRRQSLPTSAKLDELTDQLRAVNQTLWLVEDELRECERLKQFDDRFVELARSVYQTNDRRAAIKRDINLLLGSLLVEEKSYTHY